MTVMTEGMLVFVILVVILIIGVVIYAKVTGQIGSSGYVGAFVTNLLFWAPFGSITNVVSQPGQVIPA